MVEQSVLATRGVRHKQAEWVGMRLLFLQKTRAAEALYLGWITQSKGFPAASIPGLLELWFHYISNSKLFNKD